MNNRLKVALVRAGKAVAAGALAVALDQVGPLADALGGSEVLVPLATALILAAEKYIRYTPAPPAPKP